MDSTRLYNLENLISFRHDLHKHPETAFQEVRTRSKILEYLTKLGIQPSQIRHVAQTGLIVDIPGTAPPSGKPFCVALRADMDALPIKEENPDIDYQSTNGAGHMCGHDMHMTCLIGGTSLILEKLSQIPSDKKVRLLFQPAEEGVGGALPMVKEGAMEGVDEVYGLHCWPMDKPNKMLVKKGYTLGRVTRINIVIHGKGGHSSLIDQLKDPLQPAVDIQVGLRELIKHWEDKGEKFTMSLPYLKTGDAPNAVADTCEIKGFLRTFGEAITKDFKERLTKLVEDTCREYECTPEIKLEEIFPPVFNTDKETEHVLRVGKKVYGDDNATDNDPRLPIYPGDDFAYFSNERPGAFFFLGAARGDKDELHSNKWNANDEMIPKACEMWLRLVEDRLGLNSSE